MPVPAHHDVHISIVWVWQVIVDIAALGGELNLFIDAAVVMLPSGNYFDTLHVAPWAMHRVQ